MSHYLIAYDIRDVKRRRQVAKRAYEVALGGQKSALESILKNSEVDELTQRLFVKIKTEVDRINIIKVMPHAILLGRAKQLDFNNGAIII